MLKRRSLLKLAKILARFLERKRKDMQGHARSLQEIQNIRS